MCFMACDELIIYWHLRMTWVTEFIKLQASVFLSACKNNVVIYVVFFADIVLTYLMIAM